MEASVRRKGGYCSKAWFRYGLCMNHRSRCGFLKVRVRMGLTLRVGCEVDA